MRVNRGYKTDTTAGDRKIIFCVGGNESVDVVFYKTILGINANKFEFKPIGSSNTLLSFAETKLIDNGFCLIDRDFRTDQEVSKLENNYNIIFLKVHEIENFFLNTDYLQKLDYLRNGVDIQQQINHVIQIKRIRFLADFLQFKINNHLDKFPRISKLKNSELSDEEQIINTLFSKLDTNYDEVQVKIREIKEKYIEGWKNDFEELTINFLPAKEIFKELKNKIFINPPKESDIAKDIAKLMLEDNFLPENIKDIFQN
jgi:hypothetical protein